MRFPTIHTFLKWFGPSVVAFCGGSIGLIAALSVPFPRVKDWAEQEFDVWWPFVSAPWFLASGAAIIAVYILALIYTGGKPRPKKIRPQPVPKSWADRAGELPPPPAPGTLLREMEVQTALSKFPELTRAGQVAKWSAIHRLLNGSWEDAATKMLKDREAEEEAARQEMIRKAREGDGDANTFSQAWDDIVSDRVPFIRIRQIAHEFGLVLDPHDPTSSNTAYDIEGVMRQAAVDERLKVWGRKYRGPVQDNDPLVPIPREHFEEYGFRHGSLHYEVLNDQSATGTIGMATWGVKGKKDVTFYDLHLSYADTRKVLDQFSKERSSEQA